MKTMKRKMIARRTFTRKRKAYINYVFDTLRYEYFSDKIEVYAEFKGTNEDVLIAKFVRKPGVGFVMTFPKNKKYSNYVIAGDFDSDYDSSSIEKKLDKYFNGFASEIKKDSVEYLKEVLEVESEPTLDDMAEDPKFFGRKDNVSVKINGKEIEFKGIRYSHTPFEIKVWAEFKGTDKEVLIASFERDNMTDKFSMVYPKNKKYSNYTLKDKFLPDYMNTYLRQKADDELDKYFEKYMSEIKKDALELIKRKMTSNKLSFRKRKAGTGYWIEFEIDVDKVGEAKVINIKKEGVKDIYDLGWAFHEKVIPFEMEVEIPIKIDINRASSYMYGIEYPFENVDAVITRLTGFAPVEEGEGYYWNIDNPQDVKDILKDLVTLNKIETTWGGGWVHVPFDGELKDIELDDDVDGIMKFDMNILDPDVVSEIEYYCSGEYLEDEEESEYESSKKNSQSAKAKTKRIEFEDDVVKVFKNGKLIYKGIEDYEPMKDEPWRWNESTKSYILNNNGVKFEKICLV